MKKHLITSFTNFINENQSSDNGYVQILEKILSKLNDLDQFDILYSLTEGFEIFSSIEKDGIYSKDNLNKLDRISYTQMIPSRVNQLWMDNLYIDGKSMTDVYEYSKYFEKWIDSKGYSSQEVYLSFHPNGIMKYEEYEQWIEEFSFDINDIDASVNKIVKFINTVNRDRYNQGYFRLGFDVFDNNEEENSEPGYAIFSFNLYSGRRESTFEETQKNDRYMNLEPDKDRNNNVRVLFQPNTELFYRHKPEPPYKDMVDFVSETGFILRLD